MSIDSGIPKIFCAPKRHWWLKSLKANTRSSVGILNLDDFRFLKFSTLRRQLGDQEFQKQSTLKSAGYLNLGDFGFLKFAALQMHLDDQRF